MVTSKRAVVVVLGDIGRSPRMQYHTRSLLSHGYHVDVVAYTENECIEELDAATNPLLAFHPLTPMQASSVLLLPFKAIFLLLQLMWTLFTVPRPSFMMLQNPPAIPSLLACLLVCKLRRVPLVLDWHNFGCTILAIRVKSPLIIAAARWYEQFFGSAADLHLCVSDAMRRELADHWSIAEALVLHDQPSRNFQRATGEQRAQLLNRLSHSLPLSPLLETPPGAALIVTATSWTADEKFDILFEALPILDELLSCHAIFVLTGKGGSRTEFETKLEELSLENIVVVTTYLDSFKDYATLLGSADLGISLHASSSGFDLPMKVADMFGSELPVCAVSYACIGELVRHRQNGLVFESPSQLAHQIARLFAEFPGGTPELTAMRDHLATHRGDWSATWDTVLLPALSRL